MKKLIKKLTATVLAVILMLNTVIWMGVRMAR